jgi:glycosyltransferase involved in cell wall biosynthesis
MDKLNVLAPTGVDNGGCGLYRIQQPFSKMNKLGLHDCIAMERGDTPDIIGPNVKEADVIVIRPRAEVFAFQLRKWEKDEKLNKEYKLDKKVYVFDHDDNTFEVSPLNPHYGNIGVKNVDIIDHEGLHGPKGKTHTLWKDGVNNFDIKKNQVHMDNLEKILREADLVTTTTPFIADYFKKFNKNVKVLPNCINFADWKPLKLVKDKWIRICFQGGSSHFADWETCKEPLKEIFKKYPNVKLVTAGSYYQGNIKDFPKDRIEHSGWVTAEAHAYRMAGLNIDIALIPLEDNLFNRCKSEIKYSEFSSLKIPSVVANIPPYSLVCKDGDNALCYNNSRELVDKLSKLIESTELRKEIGENAYKWVKENRDAEKCAHLWADAYRETYETRCNKQGK